MAGSAFGAESPSGLEKQVSSKYSSIRLQNYLALNIYLGGAKVSVLNYVKKQNYELLAHFKKKEDKEGKGGEKMTDKEKRKDALKKARSRMEKKDKKKIDLIPL